MPVATSAPSKKKRLAKTTKTKDARAPTTPRVSPKVRRARVLASTPILDLAPIVAFGDVGLVLRASSRRRRPLRSHHRSHSRRRQRAMFGLRSAAATSPTLTALSSTIERKRDAFRAMEIRCAAQNANAPPPGTTLTGAPRPGGRSVPSSSSPRAPPSPMIRGTKSMPIPAGCSSSAYRASLLPKRSTRAAAAAGTRAGGGKNARRGGGGKRATLAPPGRARAREEERGAGGAETPAAARDGGAAAAADYDAQLAAAAEALAANVVAAAAAACAMESRVVTEESPRAIEAAAEVRVRARESSDETEEEEEMEEEEEDADADADTDAGCASDGASRDARPRPSTPPPRASMTLHEREALLRCVSDTPPDREDVELYALYLGMDLERDEDLLFVAEWALLAPPPPGWSEHVDGSGREFYHHAATGRSSYEHPMDDAYREHYAWVKARRARGVK